MREVKQSQKNQQFHFKITWKNKDIQLTFVLIPEELGVDCVLAGNDNTVDNVVNLHISWEPATGFAHSTGKTNPNRSVNLNHYWQRIKTIT